MERQRWRTQQHPQQQLVAVVVVVLLLAQSVAQAGVQQGGWWWLPPPTGRMRWTLPCGGLAGWTVRWRSVCLMRGSAQTS